MKKWILLSTVSSFLFSTLFGQQQDTLLGNGAITVFTATKTERVLSNIAVPVQIISQKNIQQAGSLRLSDILSEQTGLFMTNGFGTGVSMQGLNPDYTLILIDGEPLIGRTSGVLDLKRITVGNIKQIEIVRGPSSSLYGSEAMAGVINIITDKSRKNTLGISARYGTYNTADLSLKGSIRTNKINYQGFGNFYRTDGFSIRPNSRERSVAPIERFTQQHNLGYRLSERTNLSLNFRHNSETIKNNITVINNGNSINSIGVEKNEDLNVTLQLAHKLNEQVKNTTRLYGTQFHSSQELTSDNGVPYLDVFKQQFARIENQTDIHLNKQLEFNIGGGYIHETANSTRYDNSTSIKTNRIGYVYLQSEWKALNKLTFVGGARYDHNELFAAAFSPKLAAQYKLNKNISLKASIGRGFKAPDFRQLYLNFTNTAAGSYSVFGSVEAQKIINELNRIGQISSLEPSFYQLSNLQPEFSTGFNLGASYQNEQWLITANIFRNNIENLIDSRLVAYKTGGAQIFSYLNVKNAFTQGIETDIKYQYNQKWGLSAGYQFLLTGDQAEINAINEGKVFTRDQNGFSRKMSQSEYVGLPNRSKHMANIKLQYDHQQFFANARALYRSRWATTDTDGNGIFNTNDAFAKGYIQLNMAAGKSFTNGVAVQAGIDNLLNYTDVLNLPNLPGRTFYLSVSYNFLNKNPK
ncbi:TonB-dependent siderophore receptor [Sediminibacterium sp.]|jgi:outer membrane receptor for ferrienterochelin and colicins|uniref:TonB-dependent receptor plug domain-containing protein n=1 Tax=Sediminibacterium sp. TaxID=1917865 RepID=UPI0025F8619A|nr:TonB-dependent receptor [Sediminibacterium sp.]MDP2422066.1 TonB-dependent receptor [Sediminibacterium sp.]HPH36522.1 TonB-dependent receptor [Sediminibacterium sp.]